MITYVRVREVFDYDCGRLLWKIKASRNTVIGSVAGCRNKGYLLVRIDGALYGAHRLVWCYFNGELPDRDIDHINHVTDDNRIENLRLATRGENMQNRLMAQSNSASGLLGASFDKQRRLWIAQIVENKKRTYLGHFASAHDAHQAYLRAKATLHPFQTIVT